MYQLVQIGCFQSQLVHYCAVSWGRFTSYFRNGPKNVPGNDKHPPINSRDARRLYVRCNDNDPTCGNRPIRIAGLKRERDVDRAEIMVPAAYYSSLLWNPTHH